MNLRSIQEAAWIARFIHIVILGAIVVVGIRFGSHAWVAALTALWFVLFAAAYLFVNRPHR